MITLPANAAAMLEQDSTGKFAKVSSVSGGQVTIELKDGFSFKVTPVKKDKTAYMIGDKIRFGADGVMTSKEDAALPKVKASSSTGGSNYVKSKL